MTLEPDRGRATLFAYVFKTRADPFAGRINLFRVYQGIDERTTRRCSTRAPTPRSASASCSCRRARRSTHADAFGPGDIGAVAKLKETRAGDWLADRDQPITMPSIELPGAGDGVRDRAEGQGRRGQGLHRAAPPAGGGPDDRPAPRPADRRADRRRALADPRRGDRRPDEVAASAPRSTLKPPRVPYQETIRGTRQGARPPQEADRRPRPVRRLPHRDRAARRRRGLRVRQRDQGRRDPRRASSPRSRRACARRCSRASSPATRSRACACGSTTARYHTVDSSEMAFKIAGSIAMKQALEQASPVLLEPIMLVTRRRCPRTPSAT